MGEQGLLARFEGHLMSTGMAPATIVNYLADIQSFSNWLSSAQVADAFPLGVKADHVRHYCRALHLEGRSVSTINRRLQALRKFYDFVGQIGVSSHNPARDVDRLNETCAASPRVLTADEVHALLNAVGDGTDDLACRDRAILLLLIKTGLKVSELVDLRVGDLMFDVDRGYIRVGQNHRTEERWMTVDVEVCAALRACMRMWTPDRARAASHAHAPHSVWAAHPSADYLFFSRQGRPLSVRSVQRLVSHYARGAGLEGVSTQTLRYTFAHHVCAKRDRDLDEIAHLLGLRDVTGVRRYLG